MAVREHNTIREGIYAGVLSATVIAVWLLIVDTIEHHPFFTPDVLGSGLLRFLGAPRMSDTMLLHVTIYTIFHYVAFAIIGIIVAWTVHQARRTPAILAGFLITFVIVEAGFYGLAALLSVSTELWTLRIRLGFARFSILSNNRATVPGFPASICQLTSVMINTLPAGIVNDVAVPSGSVLIKKISPVALKRPLRLTISLAFRPRCVADAAFTSRTKAGAAAVLPIVTVPATLVVPCAIVGTGSEVVLVTMTFSWL